MIRIVLPFPLRTLAHVEGEVMLKVNGQPTLRSVIEAIEFQYPVLGGTIADYATQQRRPFLRFYACRKDLSNEPLDAPLPEEVASGKEPLLVIGAIAGG